MIGIDGTGRTRLTDTGEDFASSWSPDGSQIALSTERGDTMDVDVINVDGTGWRTLIGGPRYEEHSLVWSPNGRRVAFVSTRTDYSEIYVANANGKKQKRLTGSPKVLTEDRVRCTIVDTPQARLEAGLRTSRNGETRGRRARGGGRRASASARAS